MAEWVTILISIGGSFVLATAGAFFGVSVYRRQARIDLEKDLAAVQQRDRRDVYEKFNQLLQDILQKNASPKNVEKRLADFTYKSLLLSSDSVFRAFLVFKQHGVDDKERTDAQDKSMMNSVAALIRAIRVDMGYPDTDLSNREILRALVSDIDAVWPITETEGGT